MAISTKPKKPAKSTAKPKPAPRKTTVGDSGKPESSGFFITLEGGEGAGKSSQMAFIKERLLQQGHNVVTSREPGGSPGAEAVRHVLLSGAAEPFGADMEAILFSASRADHVDTVIRPALQQGKIVISDRFFDSTRVYQGVSGKVDRKLVRQLERVACGETWPDLTIIIDLDPEEGMKRAGARRKASVAPDRFEKESLMLQKMRRDAYLEIAREEPDRCVVVDGSGSPETVFERLWKIIEQRMKKIPKRRKLVSHKQLTAKKSSKTPGSQDAAS
ncbi:MAG: dTMP kinase [Salaquimonas sp.]